jgi:Uma2 family endonuclease
MATVPIQDSEETFVSVREYLRTSYSPDREYVDGRIVERNLGEKGHAALQIFLGFLFVLHRAEWGIEAYTELRTHVAMTKYRIPDVLVVRKGVKFEHILDQPPLIAIEILSPDDRWSDVLEKVEEYRSFRVEHTWIFDPKRRIVWLTDGGGVHQATDGALTVPGTPIRVVINEVFAELDRE